MPPSCESSRLKANGTSTPGSRSRRWWNAFGRSGMTGRRRRHACARRWVSCLRLSKECTRPRRRPRRDPGAGCQTDTPSRCERVPSRHQDPCGGERGETAVMKIAVVTAAMSSGEQGGAEAFYAGLLGGLRSIGADAQQVDVRVDESTFEAVLASYRRCYDLDLREVRPGDSRRRPRPTWCVIPVTSRISFTRFASSTTGSQANSARAMNRAEGSAPRFSPGQGGAASQPGAQALHHRSHELSAIDRRRLVLEQHSLRSPASRCGSREVQDRRDRRYSFFPVASTGGSARIS